MDGCVEDHESGQVYHRRGQPLNQIAIRIKIKVHKLDIAPRVVYTPFADVAVLWVSRAGASVWDPLWAQF